MRKLKLQVLITLDGFIAGPNSEMDWMTMPWTDDLNDYVGQITESSDTILLGRKLAEGFIPYWQSVAADPRNPEFETGKKFTDTPKVVFSNTLNKLEWDNAQLASRSLVEEVKALKNSDGGDIIAYGGAGLVSKLIDENLIDEYHLFMNPVAIGEGKSIFNQRTDLKLVKAQAFNCGIVGLLYEKIEA